MCECDASTVQRLENEFKAALQQQNSLEQWASWLRMVVDSALEEYEGRPSFPKAARQFLLKWSFYSSMVIRDLTLRSAASFGSFHLIRLLYDEYMFFIVEHKVAEATQTTPIAVMGKADRLVSSTNFIICHLFILRFFKSVFFQHRETQRPTLIHCSILRMSMTI